MNILMLFILFRAEQEIYFIAPGFPKIRLR